MMKKKMLLIGLLASVGLIGCSSQTTEMATTAVETTTINETTEPETKKAIEKEDLSESKKLEILAFINGQIDPLYDTDISDADLEKKADEIWTEAEKKFNVSENDIFMIMTDTNLVKKYYSGETAKNEIKTYDATLEDKGYGSVVLAISRDALDEWLKAIENNDENMMNSMVEEGKIALEGNGTKVYVKDVGIAVTKVELLEGANKGAIAYVMSEQVEMK